MKIGICCNAFSINYEIARSLGFDYCEANFHELVKEDEESFSALLSNVKNGGLPILGANCFLASDNPIVGEGAMTKEARFEYLEKGFKRLSLLGVESVCFGSGKARLIPEDADPRDPYAHIKDFLTDFDALAKKYGFYASLEPLSRFETNCVNTISDALTVLSSMKDHNLGITFDYYHMQTEGDTVDEIEKHRDLLYIAHIAEGTLGIKGSRAFPNKKNEAKLRPFVDALIKAGYDGLLSVECKAIDNWEEEAREGLRILREWVNQ